MKTNPKFQPNQAVRVTILTEPETEGSGVLIDISGKRLQCAGQLVAPPGTPVKVTWKRYLVLGEVLSCHTTGPQTLITIEVEHALDDLEALAEQRRAWGI
jgi:hypothetical protein